MARQTDIMGAPLISFPVDHRAETKVRHVVGLKDGLWRLCNVPN